MQAKTKLYVYKYQLFSEKKGRFIDKKGLKIPTRNPPPNHPKKNYEKHPRGSARGARTAPLTREGRGSPPPNHQKKNYEKHPRGSARGARTAPLAKEGRGRPPPTPQKKTMKNTRGRGAGRGQAAPTPQQAQRGTALVLLPKDRFWSP